jgi:hypothetical protein
MPAPRQTTISWTHPLIWSGEVSMPNRVLSIMNRSGSNSEAENKMAASLSLSANTQTNDTLTNDTTAPLHDTNDVRTSSPSAPTDGDTLGDDGNSNEDEISQHSHNRTLQLQHSPSPVHTTQSHHIGNIGNIGNNNGNGSGRNSGGSGSFTAAVMGNGRRTSRGSASMSPHYHQSLCNGHCHGHGHGHNMINNNNSQGNHSNSNAHDDGNGDNGMIHHDDNTIHEQYDNTADGEAEWMDDIVYDDNDTGTGNGHGIGHNNNGIGHMDDNDPSIIYDDNGNEVPSDMLLNDPNMAMVSPPLDDFVPSGNVIWDHGRRVWRRCTAARLAAIFMFVFAFVGFVPALMTTPLVPTTPHIPNADWRLHTQMERDEYRDEVEHLGLVSNYHTAPYFLDRDLADNPLFSRYRLMMYGVSRIWAYITLLPKIWTPVLYADDHLFTQIMTQKWPFRWILDPCPHGAPANLTNDMAKIRLAHVKCQLGDLVFDAQSMDDAVAFPGHYVYGSVTIFRPSNNGITKYTTVSITMRVCHHVNMLFVTTRIIGHMHMLYDIIGSYYVSTSCRCRRIRCMEIG